MYLTHFRTKENSHGKGRTNALISGMAELFRKTQELAGEEQSSEEDSFHRTSVCICQWEPQQGPDPVTEGRDASLASPCIMRGGSHTPFPKSNVRLG